MSEIPAVTRLHVLAMLLAHAIDSNAICLQYNCYFLLVLVLFSLYLLPIVAVTCSSKKKKKKQERNGVFLFDTIDILFKLHVHTQIYRFLHVRKYFVKISML